MDIINFGNILLQNVENNLGDGTCVKFQEIVKNNGVVYHALVIREEGSNISPSIYIDDFFNMYKAGESFDSITDMVVSLYRESSAGLGLDMDFFRNFDEVKGHLSYKLAMAGPNMDRLRSVPVRAFVNRECYSLKNEYYGHHPDDSSGCGVADFTSFLCV